MTAFKYQGKAIYVSEKITPQEDYLIFEATMNLKKNVIAYKRMHPINQCEHEIHYVAEGHLTDYLEKRKTIPHYCVLFNLVRERDDYLFSEKGVLV